MRVAWGEGSAGRGVGARGPWQGGGPFDGQASTGSGRTVRTAARWGFGVGGPAAHLPWVPAFAGTTVLRAGFGKRRRGVGGVPAFAGTTR